MNWWRAAAALVVLAAIAVAVVALVIGIRAQETADERRQCTCDGSKPDPCVKALCDHIVCDGDTCSVDQPLVVHGTVSALSALEDNNDQPIAVPVFGDSIGMRQPSVYNGGVGFMRIGAMRDVDGSKLGEVLTSNYRRDQVAGLPPTYYGWSLCSSGPNSTAPERGPARQRCLIPGE